jgi:RNA polymerase primary sigma factor
MKETKPLNRKLERILFKSYARNLALIYIKLLQLKTPITWFIDMQHEKAPIPAPVIFTIKEFLQYEGKYNFVILNQAVIRALETKTTKYLDQMELMHSILANTNTGLILSILNKLKVSRQFYRDVYQEGVLGLLKCIPKFNPDYGHKFCTYVTWWCRQSMLKSLNDIGRVIRLPAGVLTKLRNVSKISVAQVKASQQSLPLADPLTAGDQDLLESVTSIPRFKVSYSANVSQDTDVFSFILLGDLLKSKAHNTEINKFMLSLEMQSKICHELELLKPAEERAVRLYLGLNITRPSIEKITYDTKISEAKIKMFVKRIRARLKTSKSKSLSSEFSEGDVEGAD